VKGHLGSEDAITGDWFLSGAVSCYDFFSYTYDILPTLRGVILIICYYTVS